MGLHKSAKQSGRVLLPPANGAFHRRREGLQFLALQFHGLLHEQEQMPVVLVAVRLDVKINRHLGERFVAGFLDELLHKPVIVAPAHLRRVHRGLLGAKGDLMGVLIVQAELVEEALFDRLVQDQEAIDLDAPAAAGERFGQMPVDVNGFAVAAIPGQIRDIVIAVEFDALEDLRHRMAQHLVADQRVVGDQPLAARRGEVFFHGDIVPLSACGFTRSSFMRNAGLPSP
jgi:hypothetical protein